MARRLYYLPADLGRKFGTKEDQLIPNQSIHPNWSINYLVQQIEEHAHEVEVIILEKCGHFVQWDQYQRVNKIIEGFIG